MDDSVELAWSHGRGRVHATAAMLRDLTLTAGGRRVQSLAQATWDPGDAEVTGLPGHLRMLGGDFVCLPFGSATVPPDAPEDWRRVGAPVPVPPHGITADASWQLTPDTTEEGATAVTATLVPPPEHDVARIVRRVRPVPGRARIEFDLEVTARRPHRTSLGLHPILALPPVGSPRGARLDVGFAWGCVWPGRLHEDGRPAPAARFTSLDAVPAAAGGTVDLTRLPPPHPTEEVVQLVGARSPFRLHHADGTTVAVEWDDTLFDSLMLWLSDRGLPSVPWRGAYRGLGVEPVVSAFDFSATTSASDNPLRRDGARTTLALSPAAPLRTTHAIEVIV